MKAKSPAQVAADRMIRGMVVAVKAAGAIIADDYFDFIRPSGEKKSDGTQVTSTDKRSQAAAIEVLRQFGMPILAEEGVLSETKSSSSMFILDPLDGTAWWIVGNASQVTVMCGMLDINGRLECSVIYYPLIRRLIFARAGHGCYAINVTDDLDHDLAHAETCRVTTVMRKPTVAWDRTWGFKKPGYWSIPKEALDKLYCGLGEHYKVLGGPNGVTHALVAWGGDGSQAAITTALGGPWDVVGVLCVLEAGGCAVAFRDGVRVDPLKVQDYNILITAANQEAMDVVRGLVEATILPPT